MLEKPQVFIASLLGVLLGAMTPYGLGLALQALYQVFELPSLFLWGEALLRGFWVFAPIGGMIGAFIGCAGSGFFFGPGSEN